MTVNCEYKLNCALAKDCKEYCFEEDNSFNYKGKIYSYKNNRITIIKKGLYQGADGKFYPYGGRTAEGSGAKELWEFLKHLYILR